MRQSCYIALSHRVVLFPPELKIKINATSRISVVDFFLLIIVRRSPIPSCLCFEKPPNVLHNWNSISKNKTHFRVAIGPKLLYKIKCSNSKVDLWSSKKGDRDWFMQHNFIETLEATSIYKQENGSFLNIKFFFFGTKMTEENWEKGFSPTDWTSSGRCISFS